MRTAEALRVIRLTPANYRGAQRAHVSVRNVSGA
jgi:hypothetical protein